MPWHGKSLPPVGWQDEEYRLTTQGYIDLILAFIRALGLERPVVLGCSIGGKIVLELARLHAATFRALIGLESADYQAPWYDDTGWLHRPDVHGGEVAGAMMSGLIAPQSPSETRWDTLWMYMMGGPGVFKGDLFFYRADGDFRDRVSQIDTSRCPLYLLTGEYDFSCTPEDTERTAAKIKGARVTVMKEIGHFPMSENPDPVPSLHPARAGGDPHPRLTASGDPHEAFHQAARGAVDGDALGLRLAALGTDPRGDRQHAGGMAEPHVGAAWRRRRTRRRRCRRCARRRPGTSRR